MRPARRRLAVAACLVLLGTGAVTAYLRLRREVERAAAPFDPHRRPLEYLAVPRSRPLPTWGGGEVEAVAVTPERVLAAGGFGLDGGGVPAGDLPTLRASALTLWRGRPVAALAAGGVFLRRETGWEELRSGFGALHVRALEETAGGELLIGAREGLYRAAWEARTLERLDTAPVRSLAMAGGGAILAGGERGLRRVQGGSVVSVETDDPWVEAVAWTGGEAFVVTAAGLVRGPGAGPFRAVAGAEEVATGAALDGSFYGVLPDEPALLRVDAGGGRTVEVALPAPGRRAFSASGLLLVDTDAGLFLRASGGWRLVRDRGRALPPGPAHVSAIARLGERLVLGLFDGGLALGEGPGSELRFRLASDGRAWGVNALLPAGGALYVASLRGAFRFDGRRLEAIDGPGAAFSLASTREGVAIGYGLGVALPGPRLVSAFHGLPGNQALALSAGEELVVGMPSGLGSLAGGRVRWRVAAGEGRLPHPWVTALERHGGFLYAATYGGGVVRRLEATADAAYETFPETAGFKVNPGCLLEAHGRLYLGTEGRGLFRLAGGAFRPLPLPLPSPRVTALWADEDALWVGTDEGLSRVDLDRLDAARGDDS
jgi:hypothetical protein